MKIMKLHSQTRARPHDTQLLLDSKGSQEDQNIWSEVAVFLEREDSHAYLYMHSRFFIEGELRKETVGAKLSSFPWTQQVPKIKETDGLLQGSVHKTSRSRVGKC